MRAKLSVELDLGDGTDGDKVHKAFFGLMEVAYAIMQDSQGKLIEDTGRWDVRVDRDVIGTAIIEEEPE